MTMIMRNVDNDVAYDDNAYDVDNDDGDDYEHPFSPRSK